MYSVKQCNLACMLQSADINSQEHLLYKEALQMQETFQQEIAVVKHQATNPLS